MMFPIAGLDLALGFGSQRPGTTREGVNVRTYDPAEDRKRGGSRPGLVRYINQTVGGAHLIQHLNYVVDPQAEALPWYDPPFPNPDDPTGPGIAGGPNYFAPDGQLFYTDPDGNVIRNGGTGIRYGKRRKPTAAIQLVQSKNGGGTASSGNPFTLAFNTPVVAGHLVLVAVYYEPQVIGTGHDTPTFSISDSLGNTYAQAGSLIHRNTFGGGAASYGMALALYYVISLGGALTFSSDASEACTLNFNMFEYKNVKAVGPLDGVSTNTEQYASSGPKVPTSGSVNISAVGDLLFGAFLFTGFAVAQLDPGTSFVTRFDGGGIPHWFFHSEDRLASSNTEATAGWNDAFVDANNADSYVAIGASFKKA